jgi:hypothetical protein
MPVAHKDFAFIEESFETSEYPDEIMPTHGSDRFPFTVPKSKVDNETLTKTAAQLRERIAEVAGVEADKIPEGLLRALEAADAWPDENVRNAASGRVRSISTEVGEILYVEFWANPCALVHDPNNGRTTADARDKGLPYLEAIRDDDVTRAPVISVPDAAALLAGVQETAGALGFVGTVSDAKDLHDINWIGLQGVHEPLLVTPTLVEDDDGNHTWMLKVDDGNRRLAMLRRCLREATGFSLSEIETWADHISQADGTKRLSDWTAADVENVRRKATYKDPTYWRPRSGSTEAVEAWLASANVIKRTVIRTSVVPSRMVVGYRNLKGSPTQRSNSLEAVQRYIRRTHIRTAAQREWSPAAQAMQVALDSMRRMQVRSATTTGYTMALSQDELDAVYTNKIVDWAGADADDPSHPLRLGSKTIATFICTDMTADGDVKLSLTAHSMSTHHSKVREARAEVAASVALPIFGLKPDERRGGDFTRARAAVDRASRHPMFVAVKRHPDAGRDPWWRYLNHSVGDLEALADEEFDDGMDSAPDDKGVGGYGPATRALLFLATIGMATNPAVRTPMAGEAASPWQLTLNGLGWTRGVTGTTPDLVMSNVLAQRKKDGVHQLAEVVKASLVGAIPKNTLDPTAADLDARGVPVARTRGTLTETYLRSTALGWRAEGRGAKGKATSQDTSGMDPFDRAMTALRDSVAAAAANAVPFRDASTEVGTRFRATGLPENYADSLTEQLDAVKDVLQEGRFIGRSLGAMSTVADDGEDDQ